MRHIVIEPLVTSSWRRRSSGAVLIEILIALALLGVIATSFIGAMYTSLQAARIADERSIALTLSTSELEYVKQQSYSPTEWAYTVDSSGSYAEAETQPSWWTDSQPPALSGADFAGYSVSVSSTSVDLDGSGTPDEGIRRITAITNHHGEPIVTLENFELDRD